MDIIFDFLESTFVVFCLHFCRVGSDRKIIIEDLRDNFFKERDNRSIMLTAKSF